MILARILSPHDFGVAAAAAFFIQIAHRLTNFGINTALIQLKEVDRTLASTVFFLNLAAGAAVWALLTFGATWLGAVFNSSEAATVMPVVALSFLIGPFGAIPTALLMRDLRFREIVLLEWLATWTAAVSSVALAWFGYGYWSLVSSQLIACSTCDLRQSVGDEVVAHHDFLTGELTAGLRIRHRTACQAAAGLSGPEH